MSPLVLLLFTSSFSWLWLFQIIIARAIIRKLTKIKSSQVKDMFIPLKDKWKICIVTIAIKHGLQKHSKIHKMVTQLTKKNGLNGLELSSFWPLFLTHSINWAVHHLQYQEKWPEQLTHRPAGSQPSNFLFFYRSLWLCLYFFPPPVLLSPTIFLPSQLIHLPFFKQASQCSFPALSSFPSIGYLSSFTVWAMYICFIIYVM